MGLDDRELSEHIRREATRHRAPDTLRAALRTQMALADARRPARPFLTGLLSTRRRLAAASFALGAAAAWLVGGLVPAALSTVSIDDEAVERHVLAMRAGKLTDVASNDRHEVKPWFQGRIDFAPPVPSLEEDGFPLVGGRVDRLHGAPVAALVYLRRRHVITVFVRPVSAASAPATTQARGFSRVRWADAGMEALAVSDLDRSELERFVAQWRRRVVSRF